MELAHNMYNCYLWNWPPVAIDTYDIFQYLYFSRNRSIFSMLYEVPSPPKFRKPPEDVFEQDHGAHEKPRPPETSLSRVFYKSGPLGAQYRPKRKKTASVWVTREIAYAGPNREQQVRTNLTEMIFYSIFVGMITLLSYGMFSQSNYELNRAIERQFVFRKFPTVQGDYIDFTDIKWQADVFTWLEQVLVEGLYTEYWFRNGEYEVKVSDEDRKVLYENWMIGKARIHMVRVKEKNCFIHRIVKNKIDKCYSHFGTISEEKGAFLGNIGDIWYYSSYPGKAYEGIFGNYNQRGYFQDIPSTSSPTGKFDAEQIIDRLKQNTFVTRSTRALMVYFTVYNTNLNLFCLASFSFEIPPSGGVRTKYNIRTLKLIRYVSNYDYFLLGFEMSFCVYVIYFFAEEIREFQFFGFKMFFKKPWNWIDVIIVGLSMLCLTLTLFRANSVSVQVGKKLKQTGTYVDFMQLIDSQIFSDQVLAVVVFLSWFKLVKYLSFTQIMDQFNKTYYVTIYKILNWMVLAWIFFAAYMSMGYLVFGHQVEEFSSMYDTFFTQIGIMCGDFEFDKIRHSDFILGTAYFATFILFCYYILMNLAMAILCEGYATVRGWEFFHPQELTTSKYLRRIYYNIFKEKKQKIQVPTHKERLKTYPRDIVYLLKTSNFNDEEIAMFCAKFGIDVHRDSPYRRKELYEILGALENRQFRPIIPLNMIVMGAEMDEEYLQKKVWGRDSSFNGLTIKDYTDLQARLDQVEVELERSCERLCWAENALERGIADNWCRKREKRIPEDELPKLNWWRRMVAKMKGHH